MKLKLDPPFAAKDPTDIPGPINDREEPKIVEVHLHTEELVTEIEKGKRGWLWTYNGTVPGPMVRVREGDTVVVTISNDENNVFPHNVDFHAAIGPGGGATVSEVSPGQTKTFSFKAMREGSYIYHCSAMGMPWDHVAYGMFGIIVVEPLGGLPKVDKEFYLGQSDWYHSVMTPARTDAGEVQQTAANGPTSTLYSSIIGDEVYFMNDEDAYAEHPTFFSFNGHKNALTDPKLFGEAIRVNQGEKARFFFVNGGPNVGSNFHIIGTVFDQVYTGRFQERQRYEETVYAAPGAALVAELVSPVPGKYTIVDHALFRAAKGLVGYMHVDQTTDWPHDIYSPDINNPGIFVHPNGAQDAASSTADFSSESQGSLYFEGLSQGTIALSFVCGMYLFA